MKRTKKVILPLKYKFFLIFLELASKASPSPKKKTVQSRLTSKPSTSSKPSLEHKQAASSGGGNEGSSPVKSGKSDERSQDDAFREFRKICLKLAEEPSYNAKSKILADFFSKGSSGGRTK